MKKHQIIIGLLICFGLTFIFSSCDKETYVHYMVEGRVIDKNTKEPIKSILLSFNEYNLPNPEDRPKIPKKSPVEYDGWSYTDGEFRVISKVRLPLAYINPLVYIYDYYGIGYKDTTISVDFSNVPLSGSPSKNYKGDYVLNIGDIELGKIK
ncbi:MAG: hypothetical protein FWC34_09260 [Bacteroidetes bacterium]|nr:hypothetical protein [Bacteroidota bacterium]MCL2303013.1 hypothetical protein [Lentimicrobiaceae bacterium]